MAYRSLPKVLLADHRTRVVANLPHVALPLRPVGIDAGSVAMIGDQMRRLMTENFKKKLFPSWLKKESVQSDLMA